jgi:hypothetical protein
LRTASSRSTRSRLPAGRAVLLAGILLSASTALAAESSSHRQFRDLEKSGAEIAEVRVETRDIFNLDDPDESGTFYRTINQLHPVTRPQVIRRMLLFKSGEKVSVQKIEETERILRGTRNINDVEIRPAARADGKVDIEVITRDSWSLDLTGSYSRSGGNNKSSYGIKEGNLLGTGLSIGFARTSDIDRHGSAFQASYDQAFDGWTRIAVDRGRFNDGSRTSVVVDRPFYALDTRRAARASWSDDDQVDAIYNAGELASEYRHRKKNFDVAAGWSPGLVNGWTRRYSFGAYGSDDTYAQEPGHVPTVPLPVDHVVRAPYFRFELVQDEFVKVSNYNNIARPEFFGLGLHLQAQVGRSLKSLGASESHWLYLAQAGAGTKFASDQQLLGQATVERRIASTASPMTQFGGALQLHVPQRSDLLYYAAFAADRVRGGGVADQLLIGGEEGLRGYPSRYQAGENRVVANLEVRWFSDWYLWRLVRIGAAGFFDVGRAWDGPNQNATNGGWLSDVGVGLRLAIDRTARANVLHLDVAMPLNRTPEIKAVQFLVKTELTF